MSKVAGVLATTLAAAVLAGSAGTAAAGPRTAPVLDLTRGPVVPAVVAGSSATDTATPTVPTAARVQQSGVVVTAVTTGATPTVTVSSRTGTSTVWVVTPRTRFSGLVRRAGDLRTGMRVNVGGRRSTGAEGPVAEHVVTPATQANRLVAEQARAAAARAAAAKKAAAARAAAAKKAAAARAAAAKKASRR